MKNITVSRDKVEQWLEDLEYSDSDKNVIAAIKQALAAPVQEPAGCMRCATPKKCAIWGCSPNTWPSEFAPPAQPAPVQEPVAIPEGFSLVAVKGFDELMYWLDRCERKGHLENCPDLIEPYEAFDYRTSDTTPPAAQRQWVGLTKDEIEEMANDFEEGYVFLYRIFAQAIVAKLKERNQ
jgi:hypothetical protein